jgi:hypothetical protein
VPRAVPRSPAARRSGRPAGGPRPGTDTVGPHHDSMIIIDVTSHGGLGLVTRTRRDSHTPGRRRARARGVTVTVTVTAATVTVTD